jgi:hypothetical protein
MSRPIVVIIDGITQEEIVREMNDEEYAQYLVDKQNAEIKQAEIDAKKAEEDAAKAALQEKLAEMGITSELIEVIKKL